ncbi:hypothetical protein PLANTIT3_80085 [Plantibacter sp. T3]|nr:hypothetical protein PLANTIT3_80085 [Plantibacter sp. T3]
MSNYRVGFCGALLVFACVWFLQQLRGETPLGSDRGVLATPVRVRDRLRAGERSCAPHV